MFPHLFLHEVLLTQQCRTLGSAAPLCHLAASKGSLRIYQPLPEAHLR